MLRHLILAVSLAACSSKSPASEPVCEVGPRSDTVCTMQYDPVCGCDGKTYGNACVARAMGVPRFESGACGAGDGLD